jgi:hypothetical protein
LTFATGGPLFWSGDGLGSGSTSKSAAKQPREAAQIAAAVKQVREPARSKQRPLGFIPEWGRYWLPASFLLLALMSVTVAVVFFSAGGAFRRLVLRKRRYF